MQTLHFEPIIPASLWMALAAVGVVLLGWYALRRPSAATRGRWIGCVSLMTLALAAVLLVLLNPTLVTQIPPPAGKPLLTVMVDDSQSMAIFDGKAGASRFATATEVAGELTEELEDQFEVRIRAFGEAATSVSLADLPSRSPAARVTDLSAALSEALAEDRPQGQAMVLLSDGIHNAGGGPQSVLDAAYRAKALSSPIYTRTIGSGGALIDLALEIKSPQDVAFIGQRVPVSVRVTARNVKAGQAQVALLADGKEVERQPVTLQSDGGRSSEVRFWVKQEKVGLFPYEVRIDPLVGESTQVNNSATYLLRVIDEPIRVLLVEGQPYWDSKFLMRTLASVPAVELTSIVRVADGRLLHRTIARKQDTTPTPVDEGDQRSETWRIATDPAEVFRDRERLKGIQVVVLGREAEVFLTEEALNNLQDWIARDGGALVCSRGSPTVQVNQRLAKLLPVKWTPSREGRFRMRLTDDGRDLHWLGDDTSEDTRLSALPTLATSAQPDRSKPLAVVLATGVMSGGGSGETPAVVYQPYGSGRVVVVEGAGMWRWAFLPPQHQQKEEVYSSLWHSMLRWVTGTAGLMPGQKIALRSDKISFSTDETVSATLLVRDEPGNGQNRTVELLAAGAQKTQTFTPSALGEDPGSFRINFGKLAPGRYHARVSGTEELDIASRCVFDVRVIGQEQLDVQARPDLMARIASDSGGAALGDDAADQLAAQFKQHMERTRPPRFERSTAWDKPWILLCVFALWAASWTVRRRSGLV